MINEIPPVPHADAYTFARRLREAVHDKRFELDPDIGIQHYWDASCLIYPLMGFEELPAHYPDVSSLRQVDYLVGALFSSGQLGTVALLPGHALEFRRYVENYLPTSDRSDRARNFIDDHAAELGDLGSTLHELDVKQSNYSHHVSNVLQQLRDINPSVFVLIESLAGTPESRLRRLLTSSPPLLEFAANPAIPGFHPGQSPFGEFHRLLSATRQRSNAQSRNVVDASVLTTLVALNNGVPPYPRFYTNTQTIMRVFLGYRHVREYFKFRTVGPDGGAYIDSIWRGSEYYHLRSLFPALRLSTPTAALKLKVLEDSSPSLDELVELSNALHHLIVSDRDKFEKAIEQYRFSNGHKLFNVVEDFRKVGMAHAWVNLELESTASDITDRIFGTSKHRLSEDTSFLAALAGMWSNVPDVTTEINDMQLAVDISEGIVSRLSALRGPLDDIDTEVLVSDDLFAQRWATPVSSETLELAFDVVQNRLRPHGIVDSMAPYRLRQNHDQLVSVLAMLFALEAYDLMLRLCDSVQFEESVEFNLLLCAAKLRAKSPSSNVRFQKQLVLIQLTNLWENCSEAERFRLGLGFGHCYLTEAVIEGAGSYLVAPRNDIAYRELLRVVTFMSERLTQIRDLGSVRYAFTVDFLAYCSVVVNGIVGDATSLFLDLTRLQSTSERFSRQYRFTDTLIFRDMRASIGELASGTGDSRQHCALLRESQDRLAAVVRVTRSSTVRSHLAESREALKLFGCST